VRGWLRGIVFGILVVILTIAISVWQGWISIPNGQDNAINPQGSLESTHTPLNTSSTVTTTTTSPTLTSSLQEVLEEVSYKVEYFWDNESIPNLNVNIEGSPRELVFVLSDPNGVTVYKKTINKEDMLDEKELIKISIDNIPFNLGNFTIALYDPTVDKIVYKKHIRLWNEPRIIIDKIEPIPLVFDPSYDYLSGYRVTIINPDDTPYKFCINAEFKLYSPNLNQYVRGGGTPIYLRPNTIHVIEPITLSEEAIDIRGGERFLMKANVYDCRTNKVIVSKTVEYEVSSKG